MGLDIITTYKEKFLPFMNKLQTGIAIMTYTSTKIIIQFITVV